MSINTAASGAIPNKNSIWGDVDLKSLARKVEEDATLSLSLPALDRAMGNSEALRVTEKLEMTPTDAGQGIISPQEAAQDSRDALPDPNADIDPFVSRTAALHRDYASTTPSVAKSKPADKVTAVSRQAGATGRKRKSKIVKPNNSEMKKRSFPATSQTEAEAASASSYNMEELERLERENRGLRKALVEKIRAENTYLRGLIRRYQSR